MIQVMNGEKITGITVAMPPNDRLYQKVKGKTFKLLKDRPVYQCHKITVVVVVHST